MLDSTTRSKIDALRDTLVGKLPVPSEQVKQITLGLMYKFMGDLDEEYAKLGSKPFFAGKYEQYAWRNIMALTEAPKRAELYAEGLEKMSLNPGIPQLFRDIFKGAFFPFRDPRIIGEFLKGIDEFKYEHSEDLGDAFEYLLQVSGEQGKAGQLRTPRHIIDFIVECVDPQKTDRILDPACGTAGFLVSAYKHILRENTRPGSDRPGSALTTTERNALRDNFTGYDISHDMVRISLVNMYLHLFPNPRIYEYDTLTSQDRWDEDADCILANPPFMTPKGGIRPHNRFQIKARRSEILFVDYMLEHLSPQGKMGVIVPEGIIFQSNTAYKALRKLLVDGGYLYAVVSLPGGVFNPYSGVKTSILLIDRVLAKKAQDILFVKVENDGFDLGAQRREVEGSELPQALKVIRAHRKALAEDKDARGALQRLSPGVMLSEAKHLIVVPKQKIGEDGDYSLHPERYRDAPATVGHWPLVPLKTLCDFVRGLTYDKKDESSGPTENVVLRAGNVDLASGTLNLDELRYLKAKGSYDQTKRVRMGDILLCGSSGSREHLGKVALIRQDLGYFFGGFMAVVRVKPELDSRYLFSILTSQQYRDYLRRLTAGVNINNLRSSDFLGFKIPLPPLSVQQEIVAELDRYQKVIDGARQVVENYKPDVGVKPNWRATTLGEVTARFQYGISQTLNTTGTGYRIFRMNEIFEGKLVDSGHMKHVDITKQEFAKYSLEPGDILVNRTNSYELVGRTGIFALEGDYCFASYLIRLKLDQSSVVPAFMNALLNTAEYKRGLQGLASRAIGQANISATSLKRLPVSLPPLAVQRQVVARIEEEQQLVQANRRLIELFEVKIRERIKKVWGE